MNKVFGFIFLVMCTYLANSNVVTVYVSPYGTDSNTSGTDPSTPFKTLDYTRLYIRNISSSKIVVNLMEGTHYSSVNGKPLEFQGPMDSGSSITNNIIYQGWELNNNPAIISGGLLIPSNCFGIYQTTDDINIYQCDLTNIMDSMGKPNFRTVRIGNKRGIPSRYPKLSDPNYYFGDDFVYTQTAGKIPDEKAYIIGIKKSLLSPQLVDIDPSVTGKIKIFPSRSAYNIEAGIEYVNTSEVESPNSNYSYYKLVCFPNAILDNPKYCELDGWNGYVAYSAIGIGNRLHFYDFPLNIIPIEDNNEWYFDTTTNKLYIGISKTININNLDIVIPNSDYIIKLEGNLGWGSPSNWNVLNVWQYIENIVFNNITFMDSDYIAIGYHNMFDLQAYNGIPQDSAIRISGGKNIIVQNCKFMELGGGGITIGNKSTEITVTNNIFNHIGQSGIVIVGNNTSKASNIKIQYNSISYFGELLALASGIYGSVVIDALFEYNNITYGSRWGIHTRTNTIYAWSANIMMRYNIINKVALTTDDLGGISVFGIDDGHSILYNCIQNVNGMKTVDWMANLQDLYPVGKILRPYRGYAIYLDNWSQYYNITGNILANSARAIYFHGGKNNIFENNILYNNYNQYWSGESKNDTIVHNILYYSKPTPYYGTSLSSLTAFRSSFEEIDNNLYFNPNLNIDQYNGKIATASNNIVAATWNEWTNEFNQKYDQNSVIDQDPLFIDPENGDFTLDTQSPALDSPIHFEQIPKYISENCKPDINEEIITDESIYTDGVSDTYILIYGNHGIKSFKEANEYCQDNYGTYLADVYSRDQNIQLQNAMIRSNVDMAYIGYSQNNGEEIFDSNTVDVSIEFEAISGNSAAYNNWETNEPNNSGLMEDCVVIRHNSNGVEPLWNDYNCNQELPFFCNKVRTTTSENYIYVDNLKRPYSIAKSYCNNHFGTGLATILNQQQQDELTNLMVSVKYEFAWIGLNDINTEGTWYWNSNPNYQLQSTDYNNWVTGEPNNLGNEDCALMWHHQKWNDGKCDWSYAFVCDRNPIS